MKGEGESSKSGGDSGEPSNSGKGPSDGSIDPSDYPDWDKKIAELSRKASTMPLDSGSNLNAGIELAQKAAKDASALPSGSTARLDLEGIVDTINYRIQETQPDSEPEDMVPARGLEELSRMRERIVDTIKTSPMTDEQYEKITSNLESIDKEIETLKSSKGASYTDKKDEDSSSIDRKGKGRAKD